MTPQIKTSSKMISKVSSNNMSKTIIPMNSVTLVSNHIKMTTMIIHKKLIWIPSRNHRKLRTNVHQLLGKSKHPVNMMQVVRRLGK